MTGLHVPVEDIELGPVYDHIVVAAWCLQIQIVRALGSGQLPVEVGVVVERMGLLIVAAVAVVDVDSGFVLIACS